MCADQSACSTGLAEAEGTAEMTKPEANGTSLCGINNWFWALRSHCRVVSVLQSCIGQVVETKRSCDKSGPVHFMIAVVSAATAIAIIIASTIMNTALGDRITHPPPPSPSSTLLTVSEIKTPAGGDGMTPHAPSPSSMLLARFVECCFGRK